MDNFINRYCRYGLFHSNYGEFSEAKYDDEMQSCRQVNIEQNGAK